MKLSGAGQGKRKIYLGIGSNIGPAKNIPKALELLQHEVRVAAVSTAWQNPAVGSEGPDYVNAAVTLLTDLSPGKLKERILRPIESRLGRVRTQSRNAPRTIDLDILGTETAVIDKTIWQHAHLAVPLAELDPGYTHPETGESLLVAAKRLAMPTRMYPRPDILKRATWLCEE